MNNIITPDSEEIRDDDAKNFYELMSMSMGTTLVPEKDKITLEKPSDPSRNAKDFLIVCKINNDRVVRLKRCQDYPEYIRRELAIAVAKHEFVFPSYYISVKIGIRLRLNSKNKNCKIFVGWENKRMLVIDCGNPYFMKKMKDLSPKEVDLVSFCRDYGAWAAFNYLLGVIDRHHSNFVLCLNDNLLHSIDNEDGPFDAQGNEVGQRQVIVPVKQNIERFFDDLNRPICIQNLREGFVEAWNGILPNLPILTSFTSEEITLIRRRSLQNPELVVQFFFN